MQPTVDDRIIQALQHVLLVRPAELELGRQLVLTSAPHLWYRSDLPRDLVVIDLQSVPGARSSWVPSGPLLRASVLQSLLAAGWPSDRVCSEYQIGGSKLRADIALLDGKGGLTAVIEVKASARFAPSQLPAVADTFRAVAPIDRIYITDGLTYWRADPATGGAMEVPVPCPADNAQAGAGGGLPLSLSVLHPGSVDSLMDAVAQVQPGAVVLDFALPWGYRLAEGSDLRRLLPAEAAPPPLAPDLLEVMLAWTASLQAAQFIAAVVPASIAGGARARWLRDYVSAHLRVFAAIGLPSGTFQPLTGIGATVVMLGGQREQAYADELVSRGDLLGGADAPWRRGMDGWIAGKPVSHGHLVQVSTLDDWTPALGTLEIDSLRQRLVRIGPCKALGDLCSISRGVRDEGATDRGGRRPDEAVPLLRSSDLRHGAIEADSPALASREVLTSGRGALQRGDLLMASIQSVNSMVALKGDGARAVASDSLIVLRPQSADVSPEYLQEFLNSSVGRRLLASTLRGATRPRVDLRLLARLAVPVVGTALMEALASTQGTEGRLRAEADAIEARRRSLFDVDAEADFRERLSGLQQSTNVLSTSIRSAGNIDFQIRNFYPYPLAFGYRLLSGIVSPSQLYDEQLRVAENILAFLGSVSLALLEPDDIPRLGLDLRECWRGGMSPGHWRDIVAKCSSIFRGADSNPLAEALGALHIEFEKRGLGKDLRLLIEAKNNRKHDRGPKTDEALSEACKNVQGLLLSALTRLAFFTDHPIRYVADIDVPRARKDIVYLTCLRYVGDHPGHEQEELQWYSPLRRRDLFVQVSDDSWRPLFPFISVVSCPRCGTQETYFIDRWNTRRGAAQLKSFEWGHEASPDEVGKELAARLPGQPLAG